MDEYNYHKNFYYPLLIDLRNEINSSEYETNSKKYLDFFLSGIVEFKNRKNKEGEWICSYSPLRNERIDKAIFVHIPFTRKLNDFLREALNEEKMISKFSPKLTETDKQSSSNQQIRPTSRFLNFEKSDLVDFYNLIDINNLKQLTLELFEFIEHEIVYCENYIGKIDDTQKDLVDLI
ncbi:hypothetical protein Celal_0161 [Cellulophaga algicola DSM 14237]|uniref:Uncharacterized protein n=1 Tax=Cellulophaga algicola (strain DSM 14237 / IC166 / ACAM 630) TaxID=688270 RepID=E6X7R9_CELAD|nr:hypothetical protein [Cellulophaga algicola]ADV47512.1 hypothetical protein Celal_0161 [Cellulophaga algicola DSM 14237]